MEAENAKVQPATPIAAPAAIAPAPITAKPAPWIATVPARAPTLRLGRINERLAPIALTVEGLASW
ncbi:hypothetical protein [Paraburkholderia sp.]|uniref:hypothetical protein n=1 Tax=Paraburkholderia sp. TaxID=1926495 RepID=UPI0025E8484C|nr:hypothetical protein [Paraburkholderia sp.]